MSDGFLYLDAENGGAVTTPNAFRIYDGGRKQSIFSTSSSPGWRRGHVAGIPPFESSTGYKEESTLFTHCLMSSALDQEGPMRSKRGPLNDRRKLTDPVYNCVSMVQVERELYNRRRGIVVY